MKKKVFLDRNAERELRRFNQKVQIEFEAYLEILRQEGKLDFPEAKKIDRKLFEIRIKYKGEYRGFYAYVGKQYIIALLFFQKKSQKTPLKYIKTAKRRLSYYE